MTVGRALKRKQSLSRPGKLHGFLAGVAVILGNPKAILFYMGILPGFTDLNDLTTLDILHILITSAIIPTGGNITPCWLKGCAGSQSKHLYAG